MITHTGIEACLRGTTRAGILILGTLLLGCTGAVRQNLIYTGSCFVDTSNNVVSTKKICEDYKSEVGMTFMGRRLTVTLAFAPNLTVEDVRDASAMILWNGGVVDCMRLLDGTYRCVIYGICEEHSRVDIVPSCICCFNGVDLFPIDTNVWEDDRLLYPFLEKVKAGGIEPVDISYITNGQGKLQLLCDGLFTYDKLDRLLRVCNSYDEIYLAFVGIGECTKIDWKERYR